jgi:hypothetical protein
MQEFEPGDKVRVRQQGAISVGGGVLSHAVYGATVVAYNHDGMYTIRRNAGGEEMIVPASWLEPT